MSDKPLENPVEDKPTENPIDPQPTLEELTKELASLKESNETQKNEIAGLNKSYAKRNLEYTDLVKQHETEAETKAREAKELNDRQENERNDFLSQKAEFSKKENDFNVKVKALELGFTADDIEQLNFMSVEHVESTRAYLDAKMTATKEETAKNILDSHSGKPEGYNEVNKTEQLSPLELKIINGR